MAQLSSSLFLGVGIPPVLIGVLVAVAAAVPPPVGVDVGPPPPVGVGVGGVAPPVAVAVGTTTPPTDIIPSVQDAAIGPPLGSLAPEFEQVSG